MSVAGKTVLITGGARGIGQAVAEGALQEGARVAIWSLNPASVEQARGAMPTLAWADAVDVGDRAAVSQGFRRVEEHVGPVDVLVNNAGYTLTSRFMEEDESYWRRVVDTNFWGVIYTIREALTSMLERQTGSIVNVVSDAGRVGMGGESVYAGAKGGVVAFSKSIAQETAKAGVRVNCVAPGPTRTRILESNTEDGDAEKLIDKMIRRIPLRRIAEPSEVAAAVLFLAGSGASHITGQVLSVSGGLTMV